jgi:hypothetical protein
MAERRDRRRPVKIDVETERVEGTIELSEVVRRLQRNAVAEARRARRDPRATKETEERIRTVERLAGELAGELEVLQTVWRPGKPPRGSSAS